MEPRDRKKRWLAALSVLFAALLIHRMLNPLALERIPELTHGGPSADEAPADADSGPDPDRFDRMLGLLREPPPVSGETVAPGFMKPIPGLDLTPPPPPPPEPPPPPPPEPAGPDPGRIVDRELGRFQVVGFFIAGGEAAIFLQRDKQVLVVREGNLIDGKYRVERISPERMTLRAIHLDERVHLDLTQYLNASERARLAEFEANRTNEEGGS